MILTSIVVFIITSFAVYLFLSILKSIYHPLVPQTLARRIHADECSICLENVRHETQASCGHVFCGDCILAICERGRIHAKCPLCRNPITILFPNFKESMSQDDAEAKSVLEKIDRFNVMHSTDLTSTLQKLFEAPYLLARMIQDVINVEYTMASLKLLQFLLFGVIYVLSPFDLVPESVVGVVGSLDDIMIILMILMFITSSYRDEVSRRSAARLQAR